MEEEINKHYLYPSALFAEKERYMVDTILGSCVAVCLFDSVKKIGGINHYMLPLWNGNGLASPKFGNIATEKLIENYNHFIESVKKEKPDTIKGEFIKGIFITSTMGISYKAGAK